VTTATSGVLARFPWLLPVRNSFASYGASAVTRTRDRAVMTSRLVSNWGQTAAHTHGRQCLCCVPGHWRKPVRARKGAAHHRQRKASRHACGEPQAQALRTHTVGFGMPGPGPALRTALLLLARVPLRRDVVHVHLLRARVPGVLARACPTNARVQVPGTRACPCARKGALASGALARVPVRARTHRTSPVPVDPLTGWIDSVVQMCRSNSSVNRFFGYTRCGNCFAPSQIWFDEIGTNLHVFSGSRYQNMNLLTRWCQFPLFFFNTPFFCVKQRCLGMIK